MAWRNGQRQGRTSGDHPIDPGVARDLSELARRMQAEVDSTALLELIAQAAVSEVEGADHAGLSLVVGGRVHSEASTSDLVRRVDELQHRVNDGPCLRALRELITIRSDDLSLEPRWPRFAMAATELGVRSMLSVQLFVEGDNLGALNLYGEEAKSFTDADESVALLLAAHAAVAMVDARKIHNLQLALESRDVIGQAKGILMERFKINAQQAFGMLVASSQGTHRKLSVIAEGIATTGEVPDAAQ